MNLVLRIGSSAPLELRTVIVELALDLARSGAVGSVIREREDGKAIRVLLRPRGGELHCEATPDGGLVATTAEGSERLPAALPPDRLTALPDSRRSHVWLFGGAPDFDRRLRMTARVITEARRRRMALVIAAVGDLPEEMLRTASPDHLLQHLEPEEYVALLGRAEGCLEASRDSSERSLHSRIAHASGLPVVSYDPDGRLGTIGATEWSGDAFCEALSREHARLKSDPAEYDSVRRIFARGVGLELS